MKQCLFSILIPVYNVEKYLIECLESVVRQTYKNYEVIIIDDGSTDKSGEICNAYAENDERIKVFHQENKGLMMTRREAVLKAKGTYCLFLDSDDYYEPDLLECVSSFISEHEYDILIFNKSILYQNKKKSNELFCGKVQYWNRQKAVQELVSSYKYISIFTKVVKRELILNVLDEVYIPINYAEDLLQSGYFMINANEICVINKCLYNYRIRKSSLIHQMTMERIYETLKVKIKIFNLLKAQGYLPETYENSYKANILGDFMDSVYRLNNMECIMMQKKKNLSELREIPFVKELLAENTSKTLLKYNKMRVVLLRNGLYDILIRIDKILIHIQNFIYKIKHMDAFE